MSPKTIETAPRDNKSEILVWSDGGWWPAELKKGRWVCSINTRIVLVPTHWHPLPENPT